MRYPRCTFSLLRPADLRSQLFPYTTLFRSVEVERCIGLERRRAVVLQQRPVQGQVVVLGVERDGAAGDRESRRINSRHLGSSYDGFCLEQNTFTIEHTIVAGRSTRGVVGVH